MERGDFQRFLNARGQRSIDTLQRYGESVERTLLAWDSEERAFSLGQRLEETRAEQKEATSSRIGREILAWVANHPGRTREEILAGVTGNTTARRDEFNRLAGEDILSRSGGGQKGDPYTYACAEPFQGF